MKNFNKNFNKKFGLIVGLLLIAVAIMGAKIGDDAVRIGSKTGADIEIQMGDGSIKWNDATSKMQFSDDGAVFKEFGTGIGGGEAGINFITNSGFEDDAILLGEWTATGTSTFVATTTPGEVGFGKRAAVWDAGANGEQLNSDAKPIDAGLFSGNCMASIFYRGNGTNIKLQAFDETNVLNEVDLIDSTGQYREAFITFVCPPSGNMVLRLEASADTALIQVDRMIIGENTKLGLVSQSEILGSLILDTTASCSFNSTSGSFVNYSAVGACPVPTVRGQLSAPDTEIPGGKVVNLPSGKYIVTVFAAFVAASGDLCSWRLHDGSNFLDGHLGNSGPSGAFKNILQGEIEYATAQTDITFQVQVKRQSGSGGGCALNVNGLDRTFVMRVERFPLGSQLAVTPDEAEWHIDANISGNFDLGTSAQATYTGMTVATASLTKNSGSAAVEIACAATTESSGTTCAAADESNGISFPIKRAGKFKACASFQHVLRLNTSGDTGANTVFQIVETPNNAQTISAEGNVRVGDAERITSSGTSNFTIPIERCGYFNFASIGKKTLRVFYEQGINTSILESKIDGDGAGVGQADIHWIVTPLSADFPMPVFVDGITTAGGGSSFGLYSVAYTCATGAEAIDIEYGSWLDSISYGSAGNCTLTLTSGAFTDTPNCTCTTGVSSTHCTIGSVSTSSINFFSKSDAGVFTDAPGSMICHGPR